MQDSGAVNKAFSAQSVHYDQDDKANRVIADLRQQVYRHIARFMKPGSRILELNAGTGIDAKYFISQGHSVLATDLSDGMINELTKKGLTAKQLSYENVNEIEGKFDYVFSNFGGLNCIDDLHKVTRNLLQLLNTNGYVTCVIMPPVCLWETMSLNFRRFNKNGVMAHIDGHYFRTWYHSLAGIKNAFGNPFEFVESEGLAALSPPPHKTDFFAYDFSRKIDAALNKTFPFDRWADHIIVTFRKR
ncbi:MAG TPA: methyltransferase domain-containing protein [Cyclobacteriaceae bacterium]